MLYNEDLEKSVLASILIENRLLLENSIEERDFKSELHKKFFKFITQYGGNENLIMGKLSEDEKNVFIELLSLLPKLSQFKEDLNELKRLSEMRRLLEVNQQVKLAIESNSSMENVLEKIQRYERPTQLKDITIDDDLQHIVGVITGCLTEVFYPTKYADLDKYLGGGIVPSQLDIVAARPSKGKTLFAINLMLNIASEENGVAFFSLEMSRLQIVQRILSRNSGLPVTLMRSEANQEQIDRINRAINEFEGQIKNVEILDIESNPGLDNIQEILREIKYLVKYKNVKVVIIDYLQLIGGKGESRNYEIAKITRSLKLLAIQLNITIVVLSQLSRQLENRIDTTPKLSDLRDSGSIEQDADIVIMLDSDFEELPNELKLYIRKNRNGGCGGVTLSCSPASMQVGNMEKPF